MLKGISSVISPELVKILMEMGHGDEIVIGDGNFPAASCAVRLIRSDGNGTPELLDAILKLFPLDYAVKCPVALMVCTNGNSNPDIWQQYFRIIQRHEPQFGDFEFMEIFCFYEREKKHMLLLHQGKRLGLQISYLKKESLPLNKNKLYH